MTVLLTGFEPFDGGAINPSAEIARALDGRRIAGLRVAGRIYPVSMRRIAGAIGAALKETNPRMVVSLGLAGGEPVIRLERVGVNLADFPVADNDGQLPRDAKLQPDGPDAFASTLPMRAIHAALLKAGIPARLSDTAGTYLCNACLYLTGAHLRERGGAAPFGFIHLPYLPEQAAALLADRKTARDPAQHPSMALDTMIRAVETAIAAAAAAK
ncbi:MAG: pyroglutamyl-peptidase I [Rhodospirillales bacterium]